MSNAFYRAKRSNVELHNSTMKKLRLKEVVEERAEQEHNEHDEEDDLTLVETEQAFKGSFKS